MHAELGRLEAIRAELAARGLCHRSMTVQHCTNNLATDLPNVIDDLISLTIGNQLMVHRYGFDRSILGGLPRQLAELADHGLVSLCARARGTPTQGDQYLEALERLGR